MIYLIDMVLVNGNELRWQPWILFENRPNETLFQDSEGGTCHLGDKLMRPIIACFSPRTSNLLGQPRNQWSWTEPKLMFSQSNIHHVALKWEPVVRAYRDKVPTRPKYAVDIPERLMLIAHVLEDLIQEGTVERALVVRKLDTVKPLESGAGDCS